MIRKHTQNIIRDDDADKTRSDSINHLLEDISRLRSEVWVLRISLFVAVTTLILTTVSNSFGG